MIRKMIAFLKQKIVLENILGTEKLPKNTSVPTGDVCVLGISRL